MKSSTPCLALTIAMAILAVPSLISAEDGLRPVFDEAAKKEQGFRSLYNGVDLKGWKVEPSHVGHWQAQDWKLVYNGRARHKSLWTERSFGDFELIVDWRLPKLLRVRDVPVILPSGEYDLDEDGKQKEVEIEDGGDSGIYLRGQDGEDRCQVNIWTWPIGSGEIWGYRNEKSLTPEERRAVTPKQRADRPIGEWNRFFIRMNGDRITVDLNGVRVIDKARLPGLPKRGPIGLQDHGNPIEFANIYIREID